MRHKAKQQINYLWGKMKITNKTKQNKDSTKKHKIEAMRLSRKLNTDYKLNNRRQISSANYFSKEWFLKSKKKHKIP